MCPLRFILVFLSAALAGYFAWRTVRSSSELDEFAVSDDSSSTFQHKAAAEDKQERDLLAMVQNWLCVFVDMASGKYLWRNIKAMKSGDKVGAE
nr:Methyltransferase-related protein, putative [Ipomoea batatas]GMC82078.1 Methyltransferase-related protein, putative [Ipomoea batatas]GMC86165.1 Methyltransferase-related protein, putative [Ipomoea batatas]GMC88754.1 Methyltransferase-related protein, putative [Ipomoea batatas]GME03967.1 Methyltransferase-related protein, putative [Ipomoea batatas]